jgi:hypothetical protein
MFEFGLRQEHRVSGDVGNQKKSLLRHHCNPIRERNAILSTRHFEDDPAD